MTKWKCLPFVAEGLFIGGMLILVYGISEIYIPVWKWVILGVASIVAGFWADSWEIKYDCVQQ